MRKQKADSVGSIGFLCLVFALTRFPVYILPFAMNSCPDSVIISFISHSFPNRSRVIVAITLFAFPAVKSKQSLLSPPLPARVPRSDVIVVYNFMLLRYDERHNAVYAFWLLS